MSEEEAMEILRNCSAYDKYLSLTKELQQEVSDFIQGKKGLKIAYDPFFKHIFDPELHGDRLERLLTCLIGQEVKVKQVLPTESKRLTAESSLLIMDILVEFESGALGNVEIQKIGYDFPGERSACYSADLLVRQYYRMKSRSKEEKKEFLYRDLQKVYTIVLFETSPGEFHRVKGQYIHRASQKFDTGLEIDLLQEYIFVALDIFHEIVQTIDTELDVWLHFLSSNDPLIIGKIIEACPAFRKIYREISEFQRKPEELIGMYNEALAMLDKNTVDYMIERQQKEIERLKEESMAHKEESKQQALELRKKDEELERLRKKLSLTE